LDEDAVLALIHGREVEAAGTPEAENLSVYNLKGELAAICRASGGRLVPRKVFLDQP
jgi:hypothetical protein